MVKLYKISCPSSCGSYFGSYMQSVSVIADSTEDALARVKKWLKKRGQNFVRDEKHWNVEELGQDGSGVFDWHEDSDY